MPRKINNHNSMGGNRRGEFEGSGTQWDIGQ